MTAWRYVEETVALLAARAPKLRQAVRDANRAGYAYVNLANPAEAALLPLARRELAKALHILQICEA